MIPMFVEIHPFQDGGSHGCLLCGQPKETHAPEVIQALREENKRLKERLEKSESRRTHWDAVTLTNYEFTKTQLAEAVKVIEAIDHELGRPREVPDANWPAPIVNASDLARAFLEKVKA